MKPLSAEVCAHHTRLVAPDRHCDRCHERPPSGQELQIASIRYSAGTVVFSICESCTRRDYERFGDQLMSHEAASIFLSSQEPADQGKLLDELVKVNGWVTQNSAPGQRCDECLRPLAAEDPISTAAVAMTGAITDRAILHVVCPECAKGKTPNIQAKSDRFVARIVSTRVTAFIRDLISPTKVVN